MANNFYSGTGLLGGGTGALDAIDGAALADKDAAMIQTDGAVYFYHLDATSGAGESSPDIISPDTNAGNKRWILQQLIGHDEYIKIVDEKASGTDGGTFTQGAWQKRANLSETTDTHDNATIAANVITLQAGTYDCLISCSAYDIKRHQSRLRNTDDGISIMGTTEYAADTDNVANHSYIRGRFTITAAKDFEIQHQCTQTKAGNGYGLSAGTGENEVYVVAEFWKRR